jgi:hypothetical protein
LIQIAKGAGTASPSRPSCRARAKRRLCVCMRTVGGHRRAATLGRDLLSGDALRRMAIRVEAASKQTSAASAFRILSRLVAAAAGDRYARVPAAADPNGRRRLRTQSGHRPTRGGHGRYRRKRTRTDGCGRDSHRLVREPARVGGERPYRPKPAIGSHRADGGNPTESGRERHKPTAQLVPPRVVCGRQRTPRLCEQFINGGEREGPHPMPRSSHPPRPRNLAPRSHSAVGHPAVSTRTNNTGNGAPEGPIMTPQSRSGSPPPRPSLLGVFAEVTRKLAGR